MKKTVVAVLFGGASPEHEVSMRSAANVIPAIPLNKYHVLPIYINKTGQWFLYEGALDNFTNILWEQFGTPAILSPDATQKGILRMVGDKYKIIPVDIIFPLIHGENGEDGSIQGLCQLAGISVVGCDLASSALAMDKAFTKAVVEKTGIKQAPCLVFNHVKTYDEVEKNKMFKDIRYKIGYPCFVKPASTGSSVGISRATNKKTLEAAITEALLYDQKIIIEKAIVGRELEVSVMGTKNPQASPVGEILISDGFYDYDAKYIKEIPTDVKPTLPAGKAAEIQQAAIEIYKTLDARGYARVDFFLEDKTENVIFNEMNTIPGFTSISMFPKLFMETGMSFSQLVDKLIGFAKEE